MSVTTKTVAEDDQAIIEAARHRDAVLACYAPRAEELGDARYGRLVGVECAAQERIAHCVPTSIAGIRAIVDELADYISGKIDGQKPDSYCFIDVTPKEVPVPDLVLVNLAKAFENIMGARGSEHTQPSLAPFETPLREARGLANALVLMLGGRDRVTLTHNDNDADIGYADAFADSLERVAMLLRDQTQLAVDLFDGTRDRPDGPFMLGCGSP